MVIVVLGILIALVVPNIKDMKKESITAQIASNITIIQSAVDTYHLTNNSMYPTSVQPKFDEPRLIKRDKLFPEHLKKEWPNNQYYWVDYSGRVWGSSVHMPKEISIENGFLKWSDVDSAIGYQIYEVTNEGKVLSSSYSKKKLKESFNLKKTNTSKLYQHKMEEDSNYFVSAIDEYGMMTPPTGLEYNLFSNPIEMDKGLTEQSLSITVGSNVLSEWLAFKKEDFQPEGTSITYEFATSDNRKDFTAFTEDFEELKDAHYLKVKVTFRRTGSNTPVLHSMDVAYRNLETNIVYQEPILTEHLSNTESLKTLGEENASPLTGTVMSEVDFSIIATESTNSSLTIPATSTTGIVVQVANIGSTNYLGSVTPVVSKPYGSTVTHTYQTSTDGVNWSSNTHYPRYSGGGHYVKMTTHYTNPTGQPIYLEKPIVTVTSKPSSHEEILDTKDALALDSNIPVVEYEEISRFSVTQNAGSVVDWTTLTTMEDLPEKTRIRYQFHTSPDNVNWVLDGSSIEDAQNSRYLKIEVIREKVKGTTISSEPILYELFVEYVTLTGTKGSATPYDQKDKLVTTFPKIGVEVIEYIVPVTGVYTLEVSGGRGGKAGTYCVNSYGGGCTTGSLGSYGVFQSANFELIKGEVLYIYQGLSGGSGGNHTNRTGSGGCHLYGRAGGGGGGAASEIRLNENTSDNMLISSTGGKGANGKGSTSGCVYGSAGIGGAGSDFGRGKNASTYIGGGGGGTTTIHPSFIEGTNVLKSANTITGTVKVTRVLEKLKY